MVTTMKINIDVNIMAGKLVIRTLCSPTCELCVILA